MSSRRKEATGNEKEQPEQGIQELRVVSRVVVAKQCLLNSRTARYESGQKGRKEGRKRMYKNVLIHRLRPLLVTLFRGDLPPYHFSLCFFSTLVLRLAAFCCLVGFLEIVVLNRRVTGIYACNACTHERLSRACLHVRRYNVACFARNVTGKCFCFSGATAV